MGASAVTSFDQTNSSPVFQMMPSDAVLSLTVASLELAATYMCLGPPLVPQKSLFASEHLTAALHLHYLPWELSQGVDMQTPIWCTPELRQEESLLPCLCHAWEGTESPSNPRTTNPG